MQSGVSPPTTFGTLRTLKFWLAGSMRSGAKASAKSTPHVQARRLEQRHEELVRGARDRWCCRGSRAGPARSRLRISSTARDHERDVGVLGLGERRRHADVDHVAAARARRNRWWRAACPRRDCLRDLGGGHVLDVGAALARAARTFSASTSKPVTREARLRELDRERQPDVAESDHADARLAGVDARAQILEPSSSSSPRAHVGRLPREESPRNSR